MPKKVPRKDQKRILLALKRWITAVIILTLLTAGLVIFLANNTNHSQLKIENQYLEIEVADEESERTRGLSGRETLAANKGMLFIFDREDRHGIWMKDMRFALDIVWLDSGLKIVDMAVNVSPDTYPQTFMPRQPVKYVLEIPAGQAQQRGWQIGDRAELNL